MIVLEKAIDYNYANKIKLFRISSDIIPFGSHKKNTLDWWLQHKELLYKIGYKIEKYRIRVSMHPGQYTVLNSPRNNVVESSIKELIYHNKFLDSLNLDSSNKIILHIGGKYNDKTLAIKEFIKNYNTLPENIRTRLVIENDDNIFNVDDLLYINKIINIPLVFDNLHNKINPGTENKNEESIIQEFRTTWNDKDGIQKIHYSQQRLNQKKGAHSQTINIKEFIKFYNKLENIKLDIMLEVKDKDISAIKCINSLDSIINSSTRKNTDTIWAKYKYLVMEHSIETYNEIKKLIRENNINVVELYNLTDMAINLEHSKANFLNAVQHVWGYFKKCANITEKTRIKKYFEMIETGNYNISNIKNFLHTLSIKYSEEYLLNSYFFCY